MAKKRKGTVRVVSEAELEETLGASGNDDDRRGDPRIDARLEIEVPMASWDELRKVYTANLSHGGLLFSVSGPAKLAGVVEVTLKLPDGQEIRLPSEVRHVAAQKGGSGWDVGVQFKDLAPDAKSTIEKALARLRS